MYSKAGVVLLGATGSGKDTHCRILKETFFRDMSNSLFVENIKFSTPAKRETEKEFGWQRGTLDDREAREQVFVPDAITGQPTKVTGGDYIHNLYEYANSYDKQFSIRKTLKYYQLKKYTPNRILVFTDIRNLEEIRVIEMLALKMPFLFVFLKSHKRNENRVTDREIKNIWFKLQKIIPPTPYFATSVTLNTDREVAYNAKRIYYSVCKILGE